MGTNLYKTLPMFSESSDKYSSSDEISEEFSEDIDTDIKVHKFSKNESIFYKDFFSGIYDLPK